MTKKSSNILKQMQEWLDYYNKTKEKNDKDINDSLKLWVDLYLGFIDKITLFSSWILSVFSSIYLINLKDININKYLLVFIFGSFLLSITFWVFIRYFYSKYYLHDASLIYLRDEKKYINSLFWYENSDWVKINSEQHKRMWVLNYKDLEKKEKDTENKIQWYLKKAELLTFYTISFFIIWIVLLLILFFSIV